jgi:hypothetical protein
MPTPKKLSKLSASDEESLKKLSKKERSKASYGKPDNTDIKNLTAMFDLYERYNPGKLQRMRENYALERAFKKSDPKAENKMLFWMPEDLQNFMEDYFPTIWTNKEHAEWFVKHFPGFAA